MNGSNCFSTINEHFSCHNFCNRQSFNYMTKSKLSGMRRVFLLVLFFSTGIFACNKNNNVVAQVKAQAIIDDNIISKYLSNHGINAAIIDTTGVRYIINTPGNINSLYSSSTSVTVGYTGVLLNTDGTLGNPFVQTGDIHPSFILGQVIRGWQLGIPKVMQGGTITLYVPSRQAYGPYPQTNYNLPANAVLIFTITVYNVTN